MLEEKNETKTDISRSNEKSNKTKTRIIFCKVLQKMHPVDKIIEIHLKMEKNNSKRRKRKREEKQYEIWIDEECMIELKDIAKEGNLILKFESETIRKYKNPKTIMAFSIKTEQQEYKSCKYCLEKLISTGLHYDRKTQNGNKQIIFVLIREKENLIYNIFANKIRTNSLKNI